MAAQNLACVRVVGIWGIIPGWADNICYDYLITLVLFSFALIIGEDYFCLRYHWCDFPKRHSGHMGFFEALLILF